MRPCTILLTLPTLILSASAGRADDVDVRKAVNKSLPLMQKSGHVYVENRSCFSCHHQALPALAVGVARERGFEVDRKEARTQSQFIHGWFEQREKQMMKGSGVVGGSYTTGYALWALAADEWKHDAITDAMTEHLLQRQQRDGRWHVTARRPPLEESDFTATALAIRGLKHFARDTRKSRVDEAVARAKQWLSKAKPKANEDRIYHLLALKWVGADPRVIEVAGKSLLNDQRKDGGWAQLPSRDSDAYATGQALFALHQSGVIGAEHPAYVRGVQFLLKSQHADGSWLVETRSRPFQKYFESGFPHRKSQWISICGTSWATMALTLSIRATKD